MASGLLNNYSDNYDQLIHGDTKRFVLVEKINLKIAEEKRAEVSRIIKKMINDCFIEVRNLSFYTENYVTTPAEVAAEVAEKINDSFEIFLNVKNTVRDINVKQNEEDETALDVNFSITSMVKEIKFDVLLSGDTQEINEQL